MRITIMTVGSRGDLQQYIALGRGFQAAGHQVRLASLALFERWVRDNGLDFGIIPGNPFVGMNAGVEQNTQPEEQAQQAGRSYKERFGQALEDWMTGGLQASQDADAIIFSQLCFVGYYVAEKLGVPSYSANHSPVTPTRAFPTIYGRPGIRLGGAYNRLTHFLDQQIFWQSMRSVINRARARALDLPPLPFGGPYRRMRREHHPILYGYSPAVVPRPDDWGDWIYITGYWFLDRPAGWQPPAELEAFLNSGPPPVYLGLGSVANSNPFKVTKTALSALARSGQRVIAAPGQVDLGDAELPKDIYIVGSIPHDWLFPRVAAVISHGGPGTVGAALRAGVPAMGIPFFGDQFFWARRVHELGAGAAPIPYHEISVERMRAAIAAMLDDPAIRRNAAELGRRISAEDGVARAVEAFHASMSAGRRMRGMEATA